MERTIPPPTQGIFLDRVRYIEVVITLTATLHVIHLTFIGLLTNLIGVKFQNSTPFKTHSTLMTISVVALAVYALSIGCKITVALNATYHQSISHAHRSILTIVMTISGGLTSGSLFLVLLQDQLGCVAYLIWVFLIATAAYFTGKQVYKLIAWAIVQVINKLIKHMFTNFMGFRSIDQPHSIGTTTSV